MSFLSSCLLLALAATGTATSLQNHAANLRRYVDSLPLHEHSKMSHQEAMDHYLPNHHKRDFQPATFKGNFQKRNFNTIQSVYNLTVFPKNLFIFANKTEIGHPFFDQKVSGRVGPVGNFSGYEDNIEYFWGLAPIPLGDTPSAFTKATVTQFTSGCPEVAASTVEFRMGFTDGPDDGKKIAVLKETAFWKFGPDGKITAYEASIPNLNNFVGKTTSPLGTIFKGGSFVPTTGQKDVIYDNLCGAHDLLCKDGFAQWFSKDECIAELKKKPFGTFDAVWGDNVVCRLVHVMLASIRPGHHCPHVGPTGGGKCVDVDPNVVYNDDVELYGQKQLFMCPSTD
ncbi:hypothetical protein FKW77_005418 [Venturia effusa]|uniref:Uncharacterized protein n=1 Tax=Venturia effusa TaxID=50376 RepID=A0A517L7F1_9PEZI|nr:hypothetical protein FKW77_005418 [Venturia effusa]